MLNCTILAGVVIVALLYYVVNKIRTRFHPALRNIPGPELAKWTSLWRFSHTFYDRTHLEILDLHRKHGDLVRIGPKVISVADPAMIPIIYDTKGAFQKTGFYPPQSLTWEKRQQFNVFSTRDERQHTEMKRKVANAYTVDALLKMESNIDDCGELLLKKLDEAARANVTLDLGSWLIYYAFDVVGEVTFSEKLGFLETGSDVGALISTNFVMMRYFTMVGQIPWLHKVLLGNPALPYIVPAVESANYVTMYSYRAMQRRLRASEQGLQTKEGHAGHDMLSRWTALRASDPDKMSTTDIMVALATNIFAGADTTAISLRAILYFLIKNPPTMLRLQREIDEAVAAGKTSDIPTDRQVRDHLPYMVAVIKEALRMHPATGLPMERHVPSGGTNICGTYLPGGTIVGINSWTVHYDPEIFPEPSTFKPERWLESSTTAEQLKKMDQSFFAFGAGGRICMGRHLSYIEMRKIIPRILREYDLSFEREDAEWKVSNIWFTPQTMPPCVIKRRR